MGTKSFSANNGPSIHLSWKELACKDGTAYPPRFIQDGRAHQLASVFENIRAIWGKPIIIYSGYRTPSWNTKIGGAKASQHVQGRALDLRPPNGVDINEFYTEIRKRVIQFGICGLGLYPGFVHVDIRLGNKLVSWRGSALKDSVSHS